MVLVEPPAAAAAPPAMVAPARQTSSTAGPAGIANEIIPPPLPTRATSSAAAAELGLAPPPIAPTSVAVPNPPSKAHGDWMLFAGGIAVGVVIGAAIWLLVAMRGTRSSEPAVVATAEAATLDPPAVQVAEHVVEPPPEESAPVEPQSMEVLKPVVEPAIVAVEVSPAATEPAASDAAAAEAAEPEAPASSEARAASTGPEPSSVTEPAIEPAPAEPQSKPADVAISAEPAETGAPARPESAKSATTDPQLAQLNVHLPKVAFDKVPLRQFITFVAEVSGAEVAIDYRSLRAAGFKAPTVTVRASDCTLSEVLQETLARIGLAFEPREGAIVVFAP